MEHNGGFCRLPVFIGNNSHFFQNIRFYIGKNNRGTDNLANNKQFADVKTELRNGCQKTKLNAPVSTRLAVKRVRSLGSPRTNSQMSSFFWPMIWVHRISAVMADQ